jgi:hypothetical protein
MEYTPARLRPLFELADGLADLADAALRSAVREYKRRHRVSRGATLRPGAGTPLWNELALELRHRLRRRGEKANLARYLGLPRQRVHEFVTAKTAGPDAERTLMLLVWISARRRGVHLSGPVLSRNT